MPAKRPPGAHWSVVNTQMSALTPSAAQILVAYCVLALGLLLNRWCQQRRHAGIAVACRTVQGRLAILKDTIASSAC